MDEIKPTEQDADLVRAYVEETGRPAEGPEFAAWLRTNWWVDAEHESWYR